MAENQEENLFASFSPGDLPAIAKTFLTKYPSGGVFAVEGEMGAGKTTFIKTICQVLGASSASSPTFSLLNEYRATGGLKILHFDLYRLKTPDEALDIGFEEYLEQNAYIFIEWPEVVRALLPADTKRIRIIDDYQVRRISF